MNQEITVVPQDKKKAPEFLTTICVFSFVGIGFAIIKSVTELLSQPTIYKGAFYDQIDLELITHYAQLASITDLICALVCLLGVLLMLNLRRVGFAFYVVGELSPFLISAGLFHEFYDNPFNSSLFWFNSVLVLIVSIAFVTMYAFNLKHMTK